MRQILEGIRVIEWAQLAAAPYAGSILADMGAEVIHVETVDGGDMFRRIPFNTDGTNFVLAHGKHVAIENLNRNKKSIALDVKNPEGREIMYQLVAKSDVLVTNYRRRARENLGLDYETVKQYNPKLVYASASGFGEEGPQKDDPGFELVACAASGAMTASGDAGEPPTTLATGFGDHCCAIYLATAIGYALVARERFGVGQEVKTSQLGAMIALQGVNFITYLLTGNVMHRHNRPKERKPLYNYYRCGDDRWIALAELRPTGWPVICRAIRRPDLEHDPRFDTPEHQAANCETLIQMFDEEFAKLPLDEWLRRIREAGDFVAAPIQTIQDVAESPQVVANNYIVPFEHPQLGDIRVLGSPMSFSETPIALRTPAPDHGEHTESVLVDVLGFDRAQVASLQERKVVL